MNQQSIKEYVDDTNSSRKRKFRSFRFSATVAGFISAVVVPTLLVAIYYIFFASSQYSSQTLFAVRGTTTSPLSALGLSALPGANVQSGDSYIVSDYIKSSQIIIDALNEQGVDFRSYFSKPDIDFYYSVDPAMPFDEFVFYWRHMAHVEFNSTTGITTFRVKAFSAEDAHAISQTVVAVSERLVNKLSDNARKQLISTAQDEVNRTEDRLKSARRAVEDFRNKEQALDPQLVAQSEQSIIRELQVSLADAQARRNALAATTRDSPTLRVLDRQISAVEQQIEEQKKRVGSGSGVGSDGETSNLSRTYTAYGALLLEQEFAEKAYTGAQTALEQALIEARKQDRYFAIIVEPTYPDAALFPYRTINTILVFGAAFLIWLLSYLVIQSVRDHAI